MKKFLRNLSIEERKFYYNVLCYTAFHCISSLLVEILLDHYEISVFSITAETGSIICMLSLIKIVLSVRRDKAKRDITLDTSNIQSVMLISFLYAINFILMIFSMKYSKMSTFYIILRLTTFINLFIMYIIYKEKIHSFQVILGGVVLICITLMFLTPYSSETFKGLFFCLSFTINYTIIIIYNRNLEKTKSEVISFFQGLFLALIGGLMMIIGGDNLVNFTFRIWILIIMLSFINYHLIYFQSRTLILNLVNQLLPFKFVSVFFSLCLGIFILKEKITVIEFILTIAIFITLIIYASKIKKLTSLNKNGSAVNSTEIK